MNQHSFCPSSRSKLAIMLAVGTLGGLLAGAAPACTFNYPSVAPPGWDTATIASAAIQLALSPRAESNDPSHGIVGTWMVTFTSDGSAYPGPIPAGAVVDFGTVQWHSDGTEFMISGGRPPSSGNVCMGEWRRSGAFTYELKHIALAYVSSDTPPPIGPATPAVFLGPAIIREVVTLDHTRNHYSGTFTIDQYATDGTTLLEHVGGTIGAARFTLD